jgi:MFS-type transporter involved in bile tolerance (Atg22 family)
MKRYRGVLIFLAIALLALAGDAGGTFGPSLVGLCTRSGGNDIQSGILAAAVFPALLVLCLLAIRRREARKNP